MKRIESFTVNHLNLKRGLYVSRKDKVGEQILTSFDIRMKEPNHEPVVNLPELHTIEHLGATFLRNHAKHAEDIIYFGPMGCSTGCYLVIKGDYTSEDMLGLITELFDFMANFSDQIPGATAIECGNYLNHNLPMARYESKKFLEEVLKDIRPENLTYPA